MQENKIGIITSYGIRITAIAVTLILLRTKEDYFIILSLLYGINALLRLRFFKEKLVVVSLLMESCIVCFMLISYEGILFILFYSIVLECGSLSKSHIYLTAFLNLCAVIYLSKARGIEYIVVVVIIYLILFFLIINMNHMSDKIKETEFLYDEIRRYSYELENTRNMLLDYSKRVQHVAQLEERDRISREIHDTIGHNLTGLYMQSELALKAMDNDRDEGREILKAVRDNLKESIEVMRSTVKKLKPKNFSGRVSYIKDMVENFGKKTGVSIDYKTEGMPCEIRPDAAVVLYRNTQEAITNAVRHGRAKSIKVNMDFESNSVMMTVRDNGTGCAVVTKGMGLSNMEERARLIGGEVHFFSSEGFTVVTKLPL